MASLLKVFIIGNLGRDPDMRYTPSGEAVCNFSVATNERWNNSQGELQERVTWLRVSAWGKQAENCHKYLKKGSPVHVEGTLVPDENGNPRLWKDNDGNMRASFEIKARYVTFLGSKDDSNGGDRNDDYSDVPFNPSDEDQSVGI